MVSRISHTDYKRLIDPKHQAQKSFADRESQSKTVNYDSIPSEDPYRDFRRFTIQEHSSVKSKDTTDNGESKSSLPRYSLDDHEDQEAQGKPQKKLNVIKSNVDKNAYMTFLRDSHPEANVVLKSSLKMRNTSYQQSSIQRDLHSQSEFSNYGGARVVVDAARRDVSGHTSHTLLPTLQHRGSLPTKHRTFSSEYSQPGRHSVSVHGLYNSHKPSQAQIKFFRNEDERNESMRALNEQKVSYQLLANVRQGLPSGHANGNSLVSLSSKHGKRVSPAKDRYRVGSINK